MTEQAWWVVALVAVIITGVIGFFIGRQTASSKERIDELEEALNREKAALSDYRDKVDAHFDKTAGLFVSMAGSYKDLFDHLSSGYENLAPGASRELFKDRVSALLLESRASDATPTQTVADSTLSAVTEPAPAVVATEPAVPATAAAVSATEVAEPETPVVGAEQTAGSAGGAAPAAVAEPALTLEKPASASVETNTGLGAESTAAAASVPATEEPASEKVSAGSAEVGAAETASATEEGKKPAS